VGVPTSRLVAVVVRGDSGTAASLPDAIHEALLDCDVPALVGRIRDNVVVIAPEVRGSRTVADILKRIAAEATGGRHQIGVGTSGPSTNVPSSCREALFAADYASEGRRLVHFTEVEARLSWLPTDPDRVALLIERTIGPLVEYDRSHGTDLVKTLREYLQNDGSPSKAVKILHIHRNTLAHRLRRIEGLTGRSLRSVDDQTELWLGTRAHEVAARSAG
jgi:purine catabolism regulator